MDIVIERAIIRFDHQRPGAPLGDVQGILFLAQAHEQHHLIGIDQVFHKGRDLDIARRTGTLIPIQDVVRDEDSQKTYTLRRKVIAICGIGGQAGCGDIEWDFSLRAGGGE